jgi:two-component system cell cycle response regulator
MPARVLVVDDIPTNVKLLEAKLSAEYLDVITACDGPTALSIVETEMPDLILLDVMMPEMNGFEVCERLKANPKTRHIPVVMVTALSDVSDRVRGLQAGADDFLSKPVNDIALFARIRSLVRFKVILDELRVRQADVGGAELLDDPSAVEECLDGAKVLVAVSSDFTADKLTKHLTEAGWSVERACNGVEGLNLGRQKRYDLIIAGLDLDGEDGLRLCSQFRSQEGTRHVPILLVIEETDLTQLAKGLDLGVTDYLVKPIDRNELKARARTQILRLRYHERLRGLLESSVSMAYLDPLTGLYNRRYMTSHLDRKLMEVAGTANAVSVMLFDLDHFKQVNDTHGHPAGDAVLKGVAERVKDSLRESDMVARYGGEEFVVVMPATSAEVAKSVAERLCRLVAAAPFAIPGRDESLQVTISIGVATATDAALEAADFLARADVALYQAKRGGRNQVVVAGEIQDPPRIHAMGG